MQPEGWDVGTRGHDGSARHGCDLPGRIRAEYREMPGLSLSLSQAARLWGLPAPRCAGVLAVLIAQGDLICTRDGRYVATTRLLRPQRRGVIDDGEPVIG
jgi:hypothetical protein